MELKEDIDTGFEKHTKKKQKVTIERAVKLGEKKEGGCHGAEGEINSNTRLTWFCKFGHVWEALFHSVSNGTWCPTCDKEKKNKVEFRLSIEHLD